MNDYKLSRTGKKTVELRSLTVFKNFQFLKVIPSRWVLHLKKKKSGFFWPDILNLKNKI